MSLYANINARKKAGTSRSKKNSTISKKNYKNMQDGFKDKGAYIKKPKKKFKPHTMYDENGKSYKANTNKEHLDMKKKGYGHSKGAYLKKENSGYYLKALKKKKDIGMKTSVVRKTLTNTMPEKADMKIKDGRYTTRQVMSVSADQVGGKGGRRYYMGEGTSPSMSNSRTKANMRARFKMASTPQDSIPASQIPGLFDKPKKKKKGFFSRRK
jgi:hypothetical protein